MPELSARLQNFTESVIRKMTRVAQKYDAINLSQGFPDFDPPVELTESLSDIAKSGPHQYAVTWGSANIRKALAFKQERFMGIEINPDKNVLVTCGSTEAMMAAMMTVCNPGDKVIIFSPFYENYAADAILSGAEAVFVPLNPPDFSFDKETLRKAFELKPKALILCNPSNPTGKVFKLEELEYIAGLAEKHDVFVITDEVYEHIVYSPHKHIYFASLPGMQKRTISCSSLSKTYSITGWRLGYLIADQSIIDSAKKVHDFLTVGAAAPLQEAAVKGLYFPESYYTALSEMYDRKRKIFLSYLDQAGFTYTEPHGAYYVMVDISEFGFPDDTVFSEFLAKEAGIVPVPGSSFFREKNHNFIRFHYAKKEETLHAAGEKILRIRDVIRTKNYDRN
ncbi:MAG: aminotransferase class I/II-fold pyridoxal phosphate-dependent enzyme [Spirochaetes bacterium]|nr:aminotransferase class I/II-fold pyridoxal phosphate-dependent enzyme [Spirochaetota bacterium]